MDESGNEFPKIGGMNPRKYQVEAYRKALQYNLLLVLPTGLGKTLVSAMVALSYLKNEKRCLMLAPTRPLVDQHLITMRKLLNGNNFTIDSITGGDTKDVRKDKWVSSHLLIGTPQTVEKDIKNGIANLEKYFLLIVDEAHRATGNYSYVFVAKTFQDMGGRRILAMTASPGSKNEKVDEIKANLGISEVYIKTDKDPDIIEYIHGYDIEPIYIEIQKEQMVCISMLRGAREELISSLARYAPEIKRRSGRQDISRYMRQLSMKAASGEKNLFSVIPLFTALMRLDVLSEYVETQGIEVAYKTLEEMERSEEKSMKRTMAILDKNDYFLKAKKIMKQEYEEFENPKFKKILEMCEDKIKENESSRCIVFTHFRKTSEFLLKYLTKNSTLIKPIRFVGQASRENDPGMSQKKQREGISEFSSGKYNVMLATSVAEEGLDIPGADMVIFYEPVPSEIRAIQRRGRTGRFRHGSVYILIFEGTRDQAYYYSSLRKEKKMVSSLSKDMERKNPRKIDEY
ncbi:DEAD/DEAH box helicase [Caldiplasma sukawensis]